MQLFFLELAVLLVDLLEEAFDVVLQLEHFVVAEHEGVQIGHFELAAVER